MNQYRVRVLVEGCLYYFCPGAEHAVGKNPKKAFENYALPTQHSSLKIEQGSIVGMEPVDSSMWNRSITLLEVTRRYEKKARVKYAL